MTSNMYLCPFCSSSETECVEDVMGNGLEAEDVFYVSCCNCGATGPWNKNRDMACEYWNRCGRLETTSKPDSVKPKTNPALPSAEEVSDYAGAEKWLSGNLKTFASWSDDDKRKSTRVLLEMVEDADDRLKTRCETIPRHESLQLICLFPGKNMIEKSMAFLKEIEPDYNTSPWKTVYDSAVLFLRTKYIERWEANA